MDGTEMLQEKGLTDKNCSLGEMPCRHVSHETYLIPYTKLVDDKRTMRLVAGETTTKNEAIGEYCNNEGKWIKDIHMCPLKYPKRWMIDETADTTRTQVIIHVGQQKLF